VHHIFLGATSFDQLTIHRRGIPENLAALQLAEFTLETALNGVAFGRAYRS